MSRYFPDAYECFIQLVLQVQPLQDSVFEGGDWLWLINWRFGDVERYWIRHGRCALEILSSVANSKLWIEHKRETRHRRIANSRAFSALQELIASSIREWNVACDSHTVYVTGSIRASRRRSARGAGTDDICSQIAKS